MIDDINDRNGDIEESPVWPEEYVNSSLHESAAENNQSGNVVLRVKLKAGCD